MVMWNVRPTRVLTHLGPLWMLALVAGAVIGCASPGQPKPPSLRLPQIVTDLRTERVGKGVHLRWTTSASTTDDVPVSGPLSAVLCRGTRSSSGSRTACLAIQRIPVQAGVIEMDDTLPGALASGPVSLLVYRVEVLNAAGRSAGRSEEVYAAGGAAPDPVADFKGVAIRRGVRLEWSARDGGAGVELDRREVSQRAPASAAAGARGREPLGAVRDLGGSRAAGSSPSRTPLEVHLGANALDGADAGGVVDRSAQKGMTYRYTAQRVRSAMLDGNTVVARSAPSAAVTVTAVSTFPPAPPMGLEAATGGGESPAIDLSWRPGTEVDLAGYRVYRAEAPAGGGATGSWRRISTDLVAAPAFEDTAVRAGLRYVYRVTAVDTDGNESVPGNEVGDDVGK